MTHFKAEKNYWVTQILKIIYLKIAPKFYKISDHPFILKGGESLIQGWGIIDRITDDIDLSFSLDLLGLKPIKKNISDSRSYMEQEAKKIDTASMKFIKSTFLPLLLSELTKVDNRVRLEIDKKKPQNINFFYPENIDDNKIIIETGGRSINTPGVKTELTDSEGEDFNIWSLSPERTLLEKVFGVHTDNIRGVIHHSHVKFFYDIVKIHEYNNSWIKNREMLNEIADFNYVYYRWNSESCKSIKTGPIRIVPTNKEMLETYDNDWKSMADIFNDNKLPFSFDELIKRLITIEDIINKKAP